MEGVTLDFGDISGFSIPNNSGTKIVKIKILNLGRPDLDFHSSLPDSFAKTASPIVSPLRSILLIVKSVQYTYLFFFPPEWIGSPGISARDENGYHNQGRNRSWRHRKEN
jgi:hypothetical protein